VRVGHGTGGAASLVVAGIVAGMASLAASQPGAAPAPPARGADEARAALEAGIAALHNFEYEEAHDAFVQAQRVDPGLALAYWGQAMTFHQTLWGQEDVAAGRRVLRSAAALRVRTLPSTSDRDRGWLDAAGVLFDEGDGPARRRRYAEAMRLVAERVPDDPDTASFYALALLGTMSRSLIGSHEGHTEGLAGSGVQRQVGEILSGVLARHPRHPGALHYLIHTYDDPAHASLALEAARTYAAVAPTSSHALHMPAHVFLQLGKWAEAEASDRAAFAASEAWVARKGLPPAMKSYHALAWRQYELLQLGRMAEARALIDILAPVVTATGDLRLLSDLSSMRARQVLEAHDYQRMANERNFGNAVELAAIGISAARAGNPALAELARQQLAARATAPEEGDLRPAIAIMEREVAALQALAAGAASRAVEILTAATVDELALPPPLGLPIPVIPAPELLGEVLLEAGRPGDAIERFRQALARNANRTRSVVGLARALTALGRRDEALPHYRAVLESYEKADADRPELAEARAALAQTADASPVPSSRVPGRWAAAGAGAALAAAAGLWAVRRHPRQRPSPMPKSPRRKGKKSRG
jgi:tetratricopeptide (TPR) repeat protein